MNKKKAIAIGAAALIAMGLPIAGMAADSEHSGDFTIRPGTTIGVNYSNEFDFLCKLGGSVVFEQGIGGPGLRLGIEALWAEDVPDERLYVNAMGIVPVPSYYDLEAITGFQATGTLNLGRGLGLYYSLGEITKDYASVMDTTKRSFEKESYGIKLSEWPLTLGIGKTWINGEDSWEVSFDLEF